METLGLMFVSNEAIHTLTQDVTTYPHMKIQIIIMDLAECLVVWRAGKGMEGHVWRPVMCSKKQEMLHLLV